MSRDEERAWRSYVIGSVMVNRLVDRELRERLDLTTDDFAILAILSEAPGRQLRFGELAAQTHFPKAHITYRFQRLADRGLVVREDCATDGRGAFATITPAGLQTMKDAGPAQDESARRHFFDLLTPEQVRVLAEAMDTIVEAHDREGLRP